MIKHTIAHNEEKTATRYDWELDGYTLTVIKYEGDRSDRITIASPLHAPELHVNDFYEDPAVAVNWSAIGNVNPDEAREYAANIVTAAGIADTFQDIIDILK